MEQTRRRRPYPIDQLSVRPPTERVGLRRSLRDSLKQAMVGAPAQPEVVAKPFKSVMDMTPAEIAQHTVDLQNRQPHELSAEEKRQALKDKIAAILIFGVPTVLGILSRLQN